MAGGVITAAGISALGGVGGLLESLYGGQRVRLNSLRFQNAMANDSHRRREQKKKNYRRGLAAGSRI
jgi:hypothetical protein